MKDLYMGFGEFYWKEIEYNDVKIKISFKIILKI